MSKLILDDISNTPNAYIKVNENSRRIEAAVEDAVLRSGVSPNFMNADLDMNGYNILNQKNRMGLEGFTWRGPWVFDRFYDVGDAVFFNGSSYICVIAHTSVDFDADLLADKWNIIVTAEGSLPDQGGHLGHFLSTDGANASWVDVLTVADGIGSAATAVAALDAQLNPVAKSGDFNDLTNKPATPVNADWNSVSGLSQILNKPSLAFVDLTTAQSIGGVKTFTSRIAPSSTQGILGTTTNDNAISGSIGEVISSQITFANRQTLTTAVVKDITSINLTSGHWNVMVQGFFEADAGTVVNRVALSIGEVPTTFNLDNGLWQVYPTNLTVGSTGVFYSTSFLSLPYKKAGSFTLYFGMLSGFTTAGMRAYGSIVATRVR